MPMLVVRGGRPLHGSVQVGGRKNAVLPLMAATLLTRSTSVLENTPNIRDVHTYLEMLALLGADVAYDPRGRRLTVQAAGARPAALPHELAGAIRASYYLLGVQLALFGRADVPLPGGDRIGQRPVDQHLKALAALGAEVRLEQGMLRARLAGGARRLKGAAIFFDLVSVGATAQAMLAAVLAEGTTVLHNAAREPHLVDLASYLNACGARISGAGTDTIRIQGVPELHGCTHAVVPDDIEAATFMIAAAMAGGDVRVENVIPPHLASVSAKLREAGVEVEENGESIRVVSRTRPRGVSITTLPYPGFPTDAQSQMTAFLTLAAGESHVTETLYEDRFRYVPDLMRMGARIRVEGRSARVWGVECLYGAPVEATDIRAGAALLIAGLGARGETRLRGVEHVERGYDDLVGRLNGLGASIERQE